MKNIYNQMKKKILNGFSYIKKINTWNIQKLLENV